MITPLQFSGTHPPSLEALTGGNPYVLPMTGAWKFAIVRGQSIEGAYIAAASLSKIVTASSVDDPKNEGYWGSLPANAIDGDIGTRWVAAKSNAAPQWLQIDLGRVESVTGLNFLGGDKNTRSEFQVLGGVTPSDLRQLSGSAAAEGVAARQVNIQAQSARYLRIVVNSAVGASSKPVTASIGEIQIYIKRAGGQVALWSPAETSDGFEAPSLKDSRWDTVKVPSNWEIAGYSRPTYNDYDNAVGEYRRWVTVPRSFAGQRIYWRFDGVYDGADIFVNGKKAGYHESGYTAFDVDVTGLAQPGKPNLFAVRAIKHTTSSDCDTGDFEALGGIYRNTFLYCVPQTHISDITIRTDLDAKNVNALLTTSITISGKMPDKSRIETKLYDQSGREAGIPAFPSFHELSRQTGNGPTTITFSLPVPHPKLWSAEHPNLYTAVVTLVQPDMAGKEQVEQRFGFRKITITPKQVVLWNGVPIKCAGTCRHEIWPTLGAALNDTAWRKDIALMKSANINAIRTSHYNHANRFLDLCEESGFYILDEIPYTWLNEKTGDPGYLPAMIQRARETWARDKNRPEVLAWSCGNENPGLANTAAVSQWMHRHDPTRPAFASGQWPGFPGQSFVDVHYPKPSELDNIIRNGGSKAPVVFTEQPHMFSASENLDYDPGFHDLWAEPLSRSWSVVEQHPNILGSWIWEWQNQPILSAWSDTSANHRGKPTVWFENNKGVVDGYREPKPEWWAVKMVYSPVQIARRSVQIAPNGLVTVPVENRYSFTNLNELACRWTAYAGQKPVAATTGRISCAPLHNTTLRIKVSAGTTSIRISFAKPDTAMSQVYSTVLRVEGAPRLPPPQGLSKGGPLTVTDSGSELVVANATSTLAVSKQTGQITRWAVGGVDNLLPGGIGFNLGQKHKPISAWGLNSDQFIQTGSTVTLADASVHAERSSAAGVRVTSVAPITATILSVGGSQAVGTLTVTYDIKPDAEVAVRWQIDWSGHDAQAWEIGEMLNLPSDLKIMRWSRESYFTDYPIGHMGAPTGECAADDIRFRSSKRSLRWMTLTGKTGHGIGLLATGTPLIGRGGFSDGSVTLFASREEAADLELSSAWVADHDIKLTKDKLISGSFVLRAL